MIIIIAMLVFIMVILILSNWLHEISYRRLEKDYNLALHMIKVMTADLNEYEKREERILKLYKVEGIWNIRNLDDTTEPKSIVELGDGK